MNNILSMYGYGIEKLNNENIINELKEELTVIPKNFNTPDKIKFAIYSENNKRVYIPRYYGLQKFGIPSINKLNKG